MGTLILCSFDDATVRLEVDYDNDNKITQFRCVNGGSEATRGTIATFAGQAIAQFVFPANRTIAVAVIGSHYVEVLESGQVVLPHRGQYEYPA